MHTTDTIRQTYTALHRVYSRMNYVPIHCITEYGDIPIIHDIIDDILVAGLNIAPPPTGGGLT